MSDFYSLLTTEGAAAFANAPTTPVELIAIAVGDDASDPTISQTAMSSVQWSGAITDYVPDPQVPGRFTVSTIIPANEGGFTVRQLGLYGTNGKLLVIAKVGPTFKPLLAQGEAKELRVNLVVNASNLDHVTVNIDPNVIVATRAYVGEAVTAIENELKDHVENNLNPHATTKAQIGLGNVDNYQTATQAEAEAGSANDRFMTPTRVAQAISKLIGLAFNQHTGNTSNPHQVTKAQVGLGSVENFPTATQAEAEAGTSNSLFMTPVRVAQAIAKLAVNAISSHTSDKANPHEVTKSQVGLGNVDNYTTATQAEAEAGTASDRFMTALQTAQAIAKLGGVSERIAVGAGTASAITAEFSKPITALTSETSVLVKAPAANGSVLNPTFKADGTAAAVIVRADGSSLLPNDIPIAGYWMRMVYDTSSSKWVLQNPANALYQNMTIKRKVFTTSGTYVPSAGLVYADVEIVAGGGGGGAVTGSANMACGGGGGGGGGYARKVFTASEIGSSVTVTVGVGGATGSPGGQTTFLTMAAQGGNPGGGATGSSVATITGGAGGSGGAIGGDINIPGGSAVVGQALSGTVALSGKGGDSVLGAGAYYVSGNKDGNPGMLYGGGGSGGSAIAAGTYNGGSGANGVCIVTEYCSTVANVATMAVERAAIGGGTGDAITASFTNTVTSLTNSLAVSVRAPAANGTNLTPTFQADSTAAKTIVRQGNVSLAKNDIPAAGYWMDLIYDSSIDKWVLQNPNNVFNQNVVVKRKVITASGTYTPSVGLLYADVEIVGAGGAGGGAQGAAGAASFGAGGGAGSYCRKVFDAATIGASVAVTIGGGGTGVFGANGNAGGDTSFGSLMVAGGGTGGTYEYARSVPGKMSSGGQSGTPTGGDINIRGDSGWCGAIYSGTAGLSGKGGDSILGPGAYYTSGSTDGLGATSFGGGGSGAGSLDGTNKTGGAGANGVCIITEYCSSEDNAATSTKIGSKRGFMTVTADTTLTAADLGKYIYVSTSCTITLPDATAFDPGMCYFIQAAGALDKTTFVTVKTASGVSFGGSNTMGQLASGTSQLLIPAGHSSGFYARGDSSYAAQDGTLFAFTNSGNMRGYTSLTTSRTLTEADIGCFLWGNIAAGTLTLPTPASLGLRPGQCFYVGASGNSLNIVPGTGAFLNYMATGGVGNIQTSAGLVYKIVAVSDTIWNSSCYQAGQLLAVKRFTASGTYTPTPGTKKIKVSVLGGGGGSGGCAATAAGQSAASGGGSAGSFISAWISTITGWAGASVAVTVGAAGSAGAAGLNAGGQGGSSLFGAYLAAGGGYGGGSGSATSGFAVSNGGLGTNAPTYNGVDVVDEINYGAPGGHAIVSGTVIAPAVGGQSKYGTSNVWLAGSGVSAAQGYGSGGGGAVNYANQSARAGAAGTAGIVIVEEYA